MLQNNLTNRMAIPPQIEEARRLAEAELKRRHAFGESNLCESLLQSWPELIQSRDSVLELIYLEYVLSQETNQPISLAVLQQRFPEYKSDLQKILNVDHVFRDQADTSIPTDPTIRENVDDDPFAVNISRIPHDLLGDYEVLDVIGQGGMGVVYRARQQRLNRLVAVKTMDALTSLNPAAVARFHQEAELVAKLQHPNIVQVYEVGSKQGVPYFSMELISGGTLAHAIQERPLLPATAAKLMETLARAMHYAHSQSVVHRDLKPANVLLAPSDRPQGIEIPCKAQGAMWESEATWARCEPKIADFGLAKFLEGAMDRTATIAMIGTPSYMAPEQIDPSLGTVGQASDIYALGAILYNALTGTPPFNAATAIETIQKVREAEPIPPSKLQTKIPRDLETVCLKCLHKEPGKRYPTAGALADDLQRFLRGQPIQARPIGVLERNWKWARRHPSLTALFGAVLAASIGMTLLWLRSEHSRRGEQAALLHNERLLYDRDIGLALSEYESNRLDRSREILEATPQQYRGWEWDYLSQQNKQAYWESPKLRDLNVAADLSSDGRYAAAVSNDPSEVEPEAIHVWDIEKNELRWKLDGYQSAAMCDVRFSPDGKWLLTAGILRRAGGKSGVKLWDLSNGTLKSTISEMEAMVCRFSGDGRFIFVGDIQGWVTQYDKESGEVIRRYQCAAPNATMKSVLSFDFSPDGSRMVVASRVYELSLWDTSTGARLQTLARKAGDYHQVECSPDGKTISLATWTGSRHLYQYADDRLTKVDSRWGAFFNAGKFSPDGSRFVSAETKASIEIENLRNGGIERRIRTHDGMARSVAFDSSGRYLLTGGGDKRVRVWDLAVTDQRHVKTRVPLSRISDIVVGPSSREMAVAYYRTANKIPRIEIREVATHKVLTELVGHKKMPTCLAYAHDGNRLLSGAEDQTVRIWDPATGECLAVLEGHQAPLLAVAYINASQRVISVDRSGTFIIWDTDRQMITESWRLEDEVQSVAFHPQLPIIAVACKGRAVQLYDIHGKGLSKLQAAGECRLVQFSPNGRRLVTVGIDRRTFVWHTDAGLLQQQLPAFLCEMVGQSDQVQDIVFSPDTRRLVSCARDGSILLSDAETGRELLPLSFTASSDGRVDFSPDGNTIVCAINGNIGSWSLESATFAKTDDAKRSTSEAWHQAEATSAVRSQDWFAAQFHQSQLLSLSPERTSLSLERAQSRMQLGDFAGAEEDLGHCEHGVDKESLLPVLTGLSRVYLGQQKWGEYDSLCERWLQTYGDSSSPAELNACLWYCSLARTPLDTSQIKQKLEQLVADLRKRQATYASSLAMYHYQNGEYQEAIGRANQAIGLLKEKPAPRDWMIIALSYAQLDQQRFGWVPKFIRQKIRQKIRQWGFSARWNSSLQYLAQVDAWMLGIEENVKSRRILKPEELASKEDLLVHDIEIPFLRQEWEKIAAP